MRFVYPQLLEEIFRQIAEQKSFVASKNRLFKSKQVLDFIRRMGFLMFYTEGVAEILKQIMQSNTFSPSLGSVWVDTVLNLRMHEDEKVNESFDVVKEVLQIADNLSEEIQKNFKGQSRFKSLNVRSKKIDSDKMEKVDLINNYLRVMKAFCKANIYRD